MFNDTKKYRLVKKVSEMLTKENHFRLIEYIMEKIDPNIPKIEKKNDDGEGYTNINISNLSHEYLIKIDLFVDKLIESQDSEKS